MQEKLNPLFEQRIDGFMKRLDQSIYEGQHALQAQYCPFTPMVPFSKRETGTYRSIEPGEIWGSNWDRAWFHITGTVPPSWAGQCVAARLNLGGEGLLFDDKGTPVQSLSLHTIWGPENEIRRDRIVIAPKARGDEAIDLWIEVSAGQLFGVKLIEDMGNQIPHKFGHYDAKLEQLYLTIFRKDIWTLLQDCAILTDLMKALPEKSTRRQRIIHTLNQMINGYNGTPESVAASREAIAAELAKSNGSTTLQTLAVGHAHIDTAWLWPVDETIRKCARTFANQIENIEKYPDYVFGASQAQHYAFVKAHYPALYKKIQQAVENGRWEVQGGMWVEADCNLISGESMVRQILHGKKFFKDEFGVDIRHLWLPDVFGYSAAMPQILRQSGITSFVTQKISWNQFNRFPHHSFLWRGIDGSEVITHFPPEDNYNANLSPSSLRKAELNFDERHYLDEFLTLFGIGDGGGGPTEEMIEAGLRESDLESVPKVVFGKAQDFLDRLETRAHELPLWSGELYLEYHRGTLTTQAYNKKMNRFMERRLRAVEALFSCLPAAKYPSAKLDGLWKTLLLNQFHDIIPGTSISPVYAQCRKDYERLSSDAAALIKTAGEFMLHEDPEKLCMINTLSHAYILPVRLPQSWENVTVFDEHGEALPVQQEGDGPVAALQIPAMGQTTLTRGKTISTENKVRLSQEKVLENTLIRYEFGDDGTVIKAFDKTTQTEVFAQGQAGNTLHLYEDRPVNWDAWDIDIYYEQQQLEQARLISTQPLERGPVRQGLQMTFAIGKSSIVQKIYLSAQSKRLDFFTEVDWREDHKMLRTAFTVNLKAETARYEIQYGHTQRPTHRNTSWDMARFEVVAHRWADLSTADYGCALLNNCKYGHKIHDNTLDLNLLRAPTVPDPGADRGLHQFIYSFLPHEGDLMHSTVLQEAACLNQPPALFNGYDGKGLQFPVSLDSKDIVLEVLKKAEQGEALIVRLYEPYGKKGTGTLRLNRSVKRLRQCDLMENPGRALEITAGQVALRLKPFEIQTLMIDMD